MLDFIETEARVRHILVHHCKRGFMCSGNPGLPDLILVGSHRIAWWELKSSDWAKLSSSQKTWDWKLRGCGYWVRLITPSDLSRVGEYLDQLNEEDLLAKFTKAEISEDGEVVHLVLNGYEHYYIDGASKGGKLTYIAYLDLKHLTERF